MRVTSVGNGAFGSRHGTTQPSHFDPRLVFSPSHRPGTWTDATTSTTITPMATVTSRPSLDSQSPLGNLSPLVNPHTLPNPHTKLPDFNPAAHSLARRVSSDSQAPGRASPAPRVTRRTPVPFLLEAFPAPPSHIPGTPTSLMSGGILNSPSLLASTTGQVSPSPAGFAISTNPVASNSNPMSPCSPKSATLTLVSHNNPPPSSPPTGPLPPVPGPISDFVATHRTLQTTVRSGSPALPVTESQRSQSRTEHRPRLSIEVNNPVRSRARQGSLSSLRNPVLPMGEQSEPITEEPVELPEPPIFGSVAGRKSHEQSRGDSPDVLRTSRATTAPSTRTDDKLDVEDSIANVDMSDLNALKSDNEGDGDEQASCPFPRYPPLLHSSSQSPSKPPGIAPAYVHAPRKRSQSSVDSTHVASSTEEVQPRHGALSPEISHMISATPRPRKRSTPSRSREPRNREDGSRSRRGFDGVPMPTRAHMVKTPSMANIARASEAEDVNHAGADGGNDSDSSLDLHTPLPELMLRHGMLSPNSKLLPRSEGGGDARMSIMSSSTHVSNASNVSLMSAASTCSKHPKDARDTPRRRVRHRDGRLLKGGIGLTTGLGWSDSEDEDAPSQLTRRVSSLVLSRRASVASYRSFHSQSSSRHPLPRSISHTILREADEPQDGHPVDEFGRSLLAARTLPSRNSSATRVASVRSTGSSLGRYSTYSTSSAGTRARNGSVSESSTCPASFPSRRDSAACSDPRSSTGLMPGIREQDDGVTPTRAAFGRSSSGSLTGGSVPHTPSSTASSVSLPFPVTPESGTDMLQTQPFDKDKVLPPLPPGAHAREKSTSSHRSGLQRPRVCSNASSISNSSMLGVPPGESRLRAPSPTSTPRQRPTITPRPSLTMPKSPSSFSGLPRPTTPSSPHPNAGQRYTPRPLKLVDRTSSLSSSTSPALSNQAELNQPPVKPLQPGEQSPRPGQILTYNRNVHDQIKLRSLSLNAGPHRVHAPVVSPGGAQTLIITSPGTSSAPNSAASTPVTACSQSPLPNPGPSGEAMRPKPRTGTGMVYRTNLSANVVATSRIRVPATR